jgi:hypothetical protein
MTSTLNFDTHFSTNFGWLTSYYGRFPATIMYSLPPSLRVALFAYSLAAYAVPVQIPTSPSTSPASPKWSTEAILTLVGVIVAVAGLLITLVLSLPVLQQRLRFPSGCERPSYIHTITADCIRLRQ